MKYNLAIALLISNASISEAMRLNQKFMPDIDDDNELLKSVSKKTSISTDDEEMVKVAQQKEADQDRMNHLMMQVHAKSASKSDPISGSLGHPKQKGPPLNDEQQLEWSLRAKKPIDYEVDPDEHPDTQDSIKWSEAYYGREIDNPRIDNVTETW